MMAIRAKVVDKKESTFTISTPDNYILQLNYSLPGDIVIGDIVFVEGNIVNANTFNVIRVLKGSDNDA
jgi:hypothetical protein